MRTLVPLRRPLILWYLLLKNEEAVGILCDQHFVFIKDGFGQSIGINLILLRLIFVICEHLNDGTLSEETMHLLLGIVEHCFDWEVTDGPIGECYGRQR